MRNLASLLFAGGLAFLLFSLTQAFLLGSSPTLGGQGAQILDFGAHHTGSANLVTAVVLGYRGIDTLGEIAILFTASAAAGLVLGKRREGARHDEPGSRILITGADMLFPLLLVVGFYIVLHGHLSPGGGFQGGVILAAAFFLPLLAKPGQSINHTGLAFIEGMAGAAFIAIGLYTLFGQGDFLAPFLSRGTLGELVSAGSLPLLYLALGLKVGAELASLLAHLSETEVKS